MNRQDFIALLEHPHSGGANSAERWDQRAQSFAAMKKTYGSQLTDKVIRHLTEKQILTKESSVIDIGCGSGRYALPFAAHAKKITAADISQNMLQLVAQDARQQGLTNLETLQTDWRDLSGRYDLVFASMAPVLFSMEGLEKMSALSTGFCVAARYMDMRDPILESLEKERPRKDPHLGRDQAWAIFNLLWMEGYQPEITYLERLCDAPLTMEDAMARYHIQMEDKELLRQRLQEFANPNGMVETKNETTLALITWNVRQKHKEGDAVFRNIDISRTVELSTMIPYREGRIISHSILHQPSISMVIFAMDVAEEISEETEPEAGWIRVMEGTLQVTIGDESFMVGEGQDILIPPKEAHALKALDRCKYLQISIGVDSIMEHGTFIKKIPVRQVVGLSDLIEYEPHKISSISLVQKKDLTISLFSLDQGEEMGGHASTGDAMVQILEGTAEITIDDKPHLVEAGQSIVMPANIQHSLKAVKPYKMLLTVVKP